MYSVAKVLWKEIAFRRWRATDSRWNRYVVSLVSSVTAVIRRPNSCTNSTAWWFQVPAVSMATGTKMWLLASCIYLASLLLAALLRLLWSQCQRYMSQHRCVDCFREGVDAADARKAESASISALLIQQLEATECR